MEDSKSDKSNWEKLVVGGIYIAESGGLEIPVPRKLEILELNGAGLVVRYLDRPGKVQQFIPRDRWNRYWNILADLTEDEWQQQIADRKRLIPVDPRDLTRPAFSR